VNLKAHAAYGLAILLALLAFAYVERAKGASDARAKASSDSLAILTATLRVKADSALVHQRADSAAEVQRLASLQDKDDSLRTLGGRVGDLQAAIRPLLATAGLKAAFDSLQTTHAQREAILSAQRDSAIALFRGASASRDTLATLVRQLQVQQQGLSTALAQASRKPLLDSPAVRVVEASFALYGAARLLGR